MIFFILTLVAIVLAWFGGYAWRASKVNLELERIAEYCDQYGLPASVQALVTHLVSNHALAHEMKMMAISNLNRRLDEIRVLANEWELHQKDVSDRFGGVALDGFDCAEQVRNVLDRSYLEELT